MFGSWLDVDGVTSLPPSLSFAMSWSIRAFNCSRRSTSFVCTHTPVGGGPRALLLDRVFDRVDLLLHVLQERNEMFDALLPRRRIRRVLAFVDAGLQLIPKGLQLARAAALSATVVCEPGGRDRERNRSDNDRDGFHAAHRGRRS